MTLKHESLTYLSQTRLLNAPTVTFKSEEKADIIAYYLENIFKPAPPNATDLAIEYECCLILVDPPEPLTVISSEKVEEGIKKLERNKAPIHDKIT